MRRNLRLAATGLGLLCVIAWAALGANRGWTQTTRTHMEKDPVLDGMTYPVTEKHFSPGVELLGAGIFAAVALAAGSFAFKPKTKP